jgi:hypothetical protein
MKTYKLIKTDTLSLSQKSVNGLPHTLTRDVPPPPTPDGYAYAEVLPQPTVGENETVKRKPIEQIDGKWVWGWTVSEKEKHIPQEVTQRQFRLALLQSGSSPEEVQTIINNIPDPAQKAAAQIEWDYATGIKRNHPLVSTFALALNKTEEEVDQLFITAESIGE